eukprot:SAG31_NODE_3077_length_4708_cov_5.626600_2_plen_285_part_00
MDSLALAEASARESQISQTDAADVQLLQHEIDFLQNRLKESESERNVLNAQFYELQAQAKELQSLEVTASTLRESELQAKGTARALEKRVADLEQRIQNYEGTEAALEADLSEAKTKVRDNRLLVAKLGKDLKSAEIERQQARFNMIAAQIAADEDRVRMIETDDRCKQELTGFRTQLLQQDSMIQSLLLQKQQVEVAASEAHAESVIELEKLNKLYAAACSRTDRLELALDHWHVADAWRRRKDMQRNVMTAFCHNRALCSEQRMLRYHVMKWSLHAVLKAWR